MPYILCRKVEDIFICTPGTRIPFREASDFMEEEKKEKRKGKKKLALENSEEDV